MALLCRKARQKTASIAELQLSFFARASCGNLSLRRTFGSTIRIFTNSGNERDPLIGNQDGTFDFTIPKRPIRRKITGLPAFTTLKLEAHIFFCRASRHSDILLPFRQ